MSAPADPVEVALAAIDRHALLPMLAPDQARLLAGPVALAGAGERLDEQSRLSAAMIMDANRAVLEAPLQHSGVTIPPPVPPPPPKISRSRGVRRVQLAIIKVGGKPRIGIAAPYALNPAIKAITGVQWSKERGCWHVPAAPAAAAETVATLHVYDPQVSPNVVKLVEQHQATASARHVLDDSAPLPGRDLSDVVTVPGWEHQLRGVAFTEAARAVLLAIPMGGGKCLRLSTPIATPSGWTTMSELRDGDEVFDERGEVCRVTAAHPVQHGLPCYEVELSDGEMLVASGDHRWFTQSRSDREKVSYHRSRGTVAPSLGAVHTTEEIAASLRVGARGLSNHFIPLAGPLGLPDVELPVPPYVLGAWLGDGASATGLITTADGDEMRELLAVEGYRCGPNIAGPDRCESFTIYGLMVQLRALGVLGDKHVPAAYLRASEKQRRALLAGLLDTDGTVCGHGRVQFDSTRERLAREVCELALTLGYRAKLSSKTARLDGRDCGTVWRVSFTTADPLFRLARKIGAQAARSAAHNAVRNSARTVVAVRPVPSEPVRCIAVDSPSHLFLAGRAMVPTHNTLTTVAGLNRREVARVMIVCPNAVRAVWPREVREKSAIGWHIEDGTRPSRIKGGRRINLSAGEKLERAQRLLWGCDCGAPVHAFAVNYEALATPVWRNWKPPYKLDAIVYDEVHRLKSPTGVVSKVAAKWHAYAGLHVGLSGTPLPQTPLDAFGVMRALDPGLFGTSWTAFKRKYAVMDPTGTFPITGKIQNGEELARRFMSITYRPVVELDVPPLTESWAQLELEPAARKAYDQINDELWADLTPFLQARQRMRGGPGPGEVTLAQALALVEAERETPGTPSELSVKNVLGTLLRCQQLTGGYLRDDDGNEVCVSTARRDAVTEWLADEVVLRAGSGDPVVLFARFTTDLIQIREIAEKLGVTYGEISGNRRDGLDHDSRLTAGVDLCGVQIQSGGTGIELTRARWAGWWSIDYAASNYGQARKRLHRPGQDRPVHFRHFPVLDTADYAVYEAVESRVRVIDETLALADEPRAAGSGRSPAVELPWD